MAKEGGTPNPQHQCLHSLGTRGCLAKGRKGASLPNSSTAPPVFKSFLKFVPPFNPETLQKLSKNCTWNRGPDGPQQPRAHTWFAIGREFWRIPVGCGETGCGKGPDRFPLVPRILQWTTDEGDPGASGTWEPVGPPAYLRNKWLLGIDRGHKGLSYTPIIINSVDFRGGAIFVHVHQSSWRLPIRYPLAIKHGNGKSPLKCRCRFIGEFLGLPNGMPASKSSTPAYQLRAKHAVDVGLRNSSGAGTLPRMTCFTIDGFTFFSPINHGLRPWNRRENHDKTWQNLSKRARAV